MTKLYERLREGRWWLCVYAAGQCYWLKPIGKAGERRRPGGG